VKTRDRDRLAAPVVVLYWSLLAAGLVLYAVVVSTDELKPLALGALLGSAGGTIAALRNVRAWFVLVLLLAAAYVGVPLLRANVASDHFWLAFVPSVVCAYASLAERWSLAALWFPVVIWMLTILDRTQGARSIDTLGIVLFGLLAIGFLAFLRARETRRAGLWRRVAAMPLAEPKPARVEREKPMRPLVRTAWSVAFTASTFAFAAFVAPRMWRVETTQHEVTHLAPGGVVANDTLGVPCCPAGELFERSRVREYLDLGRGRENGVDRWNECQECPSTDELLERFYALERAELRNEYWSEDIGSRGYTAPSDSIAVYGDSWTTHDPIAMPTPTVDPSPGELTAPSSGPQPVTETGAWRNTDPMPTQPQLQVPQDPQPVPSPQQLPQPQPSPPPPLQPSPSPSPLPSASPPPQPPAASAASTHSTPMHAARPAPMPARPPVASEPPILRWLTWLLGSALALQLLVLAIRPIRRAVTLRHFRRPYWDETVDQRVSNSWQLALVGLRDAGIRHDAGEQPQELARRVDLPELERCATILERARYGVGLADDDLAGMSEAADAVYRGARARVGWLARAVAWLRWPLA